MGSMIFANYLNCYFTESTLSPYTFNFKDRLNQLSINHDTVVEMKNPKLFQTGLLQILPQKSSFHHMFSLLNDKK